MIDEISSIEWAGSSTKRPVYGYASTQFDAVAQGQYLAQGTFVMPFKEVGYLYAVQNLIRKQLQAVDNVTDRIKTQHGDSTLTHVISGPSVQTTVTTTEQGETETHQHESQRIVSTLTPQGVLAQAAGDQGNSFNTIVEELQDRIWNRPSESGSRGVPRPDEFDLKAGEHFVTNGFNIMVTFGDVNYPGAPSTIKTLIDVHLTGDQRIIDTSDNTIYEQYTFFARGADEEIGGYRIKADVTPVEPNIADANFRTIEDDDGPMGEDKSWDPGWQYDPLSPREPKESPRSLQFQPWGKFSRSGDGPDATPDNENTRVIGRTIVGPVPSIPRNNPSPPIQVPPGIHGSQPAGYQTPMDTPPRDVRTINNVPGVTFQDIFKYLDSISIPYDHPNYYVKLLGNPTKAHTGVPPIIGGPQGTGFEPDDQMKVIKYAFWPPTRTPLYYCEVTAPRSFEGWIVTDFIIPLYLGGELRK
jgi:hypothetical protein